MGFEPVIFGSQVSRVNHLATNHLRTLVKLSYLYVSASTELSPPVEPTLQPGLRSSKSRYKNVVTAATSLTESFASNIYGVSVHCTVKSPSSLISSESLSSFKNRWVIFFCLNNKTDQRFQTTGKAENRQE